MNLREVQDQIFELCERGEAILAKAEREDRELSKAEREELDRIYGTDKDEGKLSALKEEESRLSRVSAERKEIAARRAVERGLFQDDPTSRISNAVPKLRNAHGDQVVMLSSKEKVADYYASQGVQGARSKGLFGEFVRAAICGRNSATPEIVASQLTSSNSSGGYLVPTGMSLNVVDLARAKSVVIQAGAQTLPMETGDLTIATVDSDPTFEAKAEGAPFTQSSIVFGQRKLSAYTIGTYMTASRELVEDSPNFSTIFEQVLARSLAAELDRLTLVGTGSAEPLGILSDPNLMSDAVGSASSPSWLDLGDAAGNIRAANHEPGAIIVSPSVHTYLMQQQTGDGVNAAAHWLMQSPVLDGKPVFASSNMPDTTMLVGDFSYLAWGIRQQPFIEISNVAGSAFQNHMVAIKVTWRGDWLVLDHGAFFAKTGISLA